MSSRKRNFTAFKNVDLVPKELHEAAANNSDFKDLNFLSNDLKDYFRQVALSHKSNPVQALQTETCLIWYCTAISKSSQPGKILFYRLDVLIYKPCFRFCIDFDITKPLKIGHPQYIVGPTGSGKTNIIKHLTIDITPKIQLFFTEFVLNNRLNQSYIENIDIQNSENEFGDNEDNEFIEETVNFQAKRINEQWETFKLYVISFIRAQNLKNLIILRNCYRRWIKKISQTNGVINISGARIRKFLTNVDDVGGIALCAVPELGTFKDEINKAGNTEFKNIILHIGDGHFPPYQYSSEGISTKPIYGHGVQFLAACTLSTLAPLMMQGSVDGGKYYVCMF